MFGWLLKLLGISRQQQAPVASAPTPAADPAHAEAAADKTAVPQPTEAVLQPLPAQPRIPEEDGEFLKKLLTGGGHTDLQHFPAHERAFLALLMRKANSAELEIPMLPAAAIEIRKLMRNPDVNLTRFSEVFRNDPSLTAEILKVANSSFYGFDTKTHDVGQAIMRVGYNQVRSVVMMFSVRSKVLRGGQYHAESELIADLALATARGCGSLSSALGVPEDEAFSRGLLSHLDFFVILGVAAEFNAAHKDTHISREMLAEAVGRVGPTIMNLIEKKWGIENIGYGSAEGENEAGNMRGMIQAIGLAVVETWMGRPVSTQIGSIPSAGLEAAAKKAIGGD